MPAQVISGSRIERGERMHLSVFLSLAGYLEGSWRLPESNPRCNTDIDYFCELAVLAESFGMDAVFIADTGSLWADVRRRPTGTFEPSVLAAAMVRATDQIGVIITMSTTFNEPYAVARRLASLDLLSDGRIGWNIVTSASDETARNYGMDQMPSHAERYERCAEFVDVCLKLWDSWAPDAVIADKASIWANPAGVQAINHVGKHFKVMGPLDTPRSPQGAPLLVQAGSSPDGLTLAAKYADVVFTVQDDLSVARTRRAAIHAQACASGRSGRVAILPGLMPVIGDSSEEAQEWLAHVESLVDEDLAIGALETRFGLAAGSLDPDRRLDLELPEIEEENGNRSLYAVLRGLAGTEQLTVREIVRRMNAGRGHLTVAGTADQVADIMAEWFDGGAADGFNLIFPTLPGSLERFGESVVPILQRRGYLDAPTGPIGRTLRGRFDADRRPSQRSPVS